MNQLEPTPWLIVLAAQQRSGTHGFADVLSRGPQIHTCGEIFNPAGRGWFDYKLVRITEEPKLLVPMLEYQVELWQGYVRVLREASPKPFKLIDLKYNTWHHLDPVYRFPGERPFLARMLAATGARVIHLRRRNLFAQACSAALASQRGVWARYEIDAPSAPEPLALDPKELEHLIASSERYTAFYSEVFEALGMRCCDVVYEEVFDPPNRISAETFDRIEADLGVNLRTDSETGYRKMTLNLRDEVANLDEVISHFAGTEIEHQVFEALDPPKPLA